MSKQSLGVAVIGAGDRGSTYTKVWARMPGVKLVAICDLIDERRNKLQSEFGYTFNTRDYREAIAREGVDVVTVCVPAAIHPDVSLAAMHAGKHVLTEKPMALSLQKAAEMTETAKRLGLTLALGFQYRNNPQFLKVKKAVDEGLLGRPILAYFTDIRQIRAHKIAMHDMENGNGGPVVDMCCHWFDLLRWYFQAEPVRVTARNFTFGKDRAELSSVAVKAPDTSPIIIEYSTGDLANLTLCWGLPPKVDGRTLHNMLGPKGMLTVGDKGVVTVTQEGGVKKAIDWPGENPGEDPGYEVAALEVVKDFTAALEEGRAPRTGGKDGEMALAGSLAAFKSAHLGRPVEIAEILAEKPKTIDFV